MMLMPIFSLWYIGALDKSVMIGIFLGEYEKCHGGVVASALACQLEGS